MVIIGLVRRSAVAEFGIWRTPSFHKVKHFGMVVCQLTLYWQITSISNRFAQGLFDFGLDVSGEMWDTSIRLPAHTFLLVIY